MCVHLFYISIFSSIKSPHKVIETSSILKCSRKEVLLILFHYLSTEFASLLYVETQDKI